MLLAWVSIFPVWIGSIFFVVIVGDRGKIDNNSAFPVAHVCGRSIQPRGSSTIAPRLHTAKPNS